jgi:putative membrane protein insertion efficiency factor
VMGRFVGAILRGLIRAYQLLIAPVLGPRCRHLPSCSEYTSEAIALHGPVRGGWMGLCRIVRCNPWGPSGYDPVPGSDGADSGDAGATRAMRKIP